MYFSIIFFSILFYFNFSLAGICEPKIIKTESEIIEKLKICNRGDKILVLHDLKVNTDNLILKICDLKHTVITRDEINIIHKRKSGLTLICIYEPSF